MIFYLLRRAVSLVAVLLVMSFIVFCLQSIIPADPARAIAGPTAPAATVQAVRTRLGLDDPIVVQYGRFIGRLAQGDLGTSVRTRQPVTADILRYLPASLELGVTAMVLGLVLAGGFAVLQSTRRSSATVRLVVLGLGSVPIFLSALLLVYFVWFRLGWLPAAGRLDARGFAGPTGFNVIDGLLAGRPEISLDAVRHLILPALALAMPIAVAVGRTATSALQDVMRQPYIRTARGTGLSETAVVLRHGRLVRPSPVPRVRQPRRATVPSRSGR